MSTTRATPKRARISLDRSIERLRKQFCWRRMNMPSSAKQPAW